MLNTATSLKGNDSGAHRGLAPSSPVVSKVPNKHHKPVVVELTVRVVVNDVQKLNAYARHRALSCLGDPEWRPIDLTDAIKSVLIDYSENKLPVDYGVELHTLSSIYKGESPHVKCGVCERIVLTKDVIEEHGRWVGKECGCQERMEHPPTPQ